MLINYVGLQVSGFGTFMVKCFKVSYVFLKTIFIYFLINKHITVTSCYLILTVQLCLLQMINLILNVRYVINNYLIMAIGSHLQVSNGYSHFD